VACLERRRDHDAPGPRWNSGPREATALGYPWSPVVTGEHPDRFRAAVARAATFAAARPPEEQLVHVASLNEWSEGHYLEPDTRHGTAWIEAVAGGRADAAAAARGAAGPDDS
jgi:hypothetical protein